MKIKYLILLSFTAFAIFACKNEVEDVFPKPSNERINDKVTELQNILTSSPDGWEVQYVTDSTVMGGFDMLMKFSNTEVTVQGDNFFSFPAGQITSLYDIKLTQIVSLVFSSYNGVFTLLADPDPNHGTTYSGENELLLQRISDNKDTIFFKTKNSNSMCKFIKHSGDWNAYFNSMNAIGNLLLTNSAGVTYFNFKEAVLSNGTKVVITFNSDVRNINIILNDGTVVTISDANVIVTSTGIILIKPIVINGAIITGFTYNQSSNQLGVNENSVTGTFSDVVEPSFSITGPTGGRLNSMVLPTTGSSSSKPLYQFGAWSDSFKPTMDSTLYNLYNYLDTLSTLDAKNKFAGWYAIILYPDFLPSRDKYYMVMFYRTQSGGADIAAAVKLDYTLDVSRGDKVFFKRGDGYVYRYRRDSEGYIAFIDTVKNPKVNFFFNEFINKLADAGTGKPYIIVPSDEYMTFTFGSLVSEDKFTLWLQ